MKFFSSRICRNNKMESKKLSRGNIKSNEHGKIKVCKKEESLLVNTILSMMRRGLKAQKEIEIVCEKHIGYKYWVIRYSLFFSFFLFPFFIRSGMRCSFFIYISSHLIDIVVKKVLFPFAYAHWHKFIWIFFSPYFM